MNVPIRQSVDKEYYSDNTRLNKSMLAEFIKSPKRFKQLNESPEHLDFKALRDGTMIHKYLLEYDDFADSYSMFNGSMPSSDMQYDFMKTVMGDFTFTGNYDKDILRMSEIYKAIYKCDRLKDETVISKTKDLFESLASWMKASLDAGVTGKLLVSANQIDKLKEYRKSAQSHIAAKDLLDESEHSFSEFHINWEWVCGDKRIPCKSLLDRVKFDLDKKEVKLIDLKTTSDINNFRDSFDKYTYGLQLAFYSLALDWYIDNILGGDSKEWTVTSYIIALEKQSCDIRVFEFKRDEITHHTLDVYFYCDLLHWHLENDLWEHRKEYYTNKGIEKL